MKSFARYPQTLYGVSGRVAEIRGEWPSGLNSSRQVTEVKLGRVRSNSGWVTSEDDLTTHLAVLRKGR